MRMRLAASERCSREEGIAERVEGGTGRGPHRRPLRRVHRMTALELLAHWVDHVPERYEARVRTLGVRDPAARVVANSRRGAGGRERASRASRASVEGAEAVRLAERTSGVSILPS